jgi:hypothetical protein
VPEFLASISGDLWGLSKFQRWNTWALQRKAHLSIQRKSLEGGRQPCGRPLAVVIRQRPASTASLNEALPWKLYWSPPNSHLYTQTMERLNFHLKHVLKLSNTLLMRSR